MPGCIFLTFLVALGISIHTVSGLECYHCDNTTSWKSCEGNLRKTKCHAQYDRCFKVNVTTQNQYKNVSSSVFAKGCADRCDASGILHCEQHPLIMCDAHCCSADLCNMSPSVLDSRCPFILIVGILASSLMFT